MHLPKAIHGYESTDTPNVLRPGDRFSHPSSGHGPGGGGGLSMESNYSTGAGGKAATMPQKAP